MGLLVRFWRLAPGRIVVEVIVLLWDSIVRVVLRAGGKDGRFYTVTISPGNSAVLVVVVAVVLHLLMCDRRLTRICIG